MPIVRVPLTQGKVALIDEADAERVLSRRWSATWSGDRWYAQTRIGQRPVRMHRFLMDAQPGEVIDHRNGNGLDNRRVANLRRATQQQNLFNIGKSGGGTSRFKGVCWDKARNKWLAQIRSGGKSIRLGRFENEAEAAQAYDDAARLYHGEFARLNFPREGERGL